MGQGQGAVHEPWDQGVRDRDGRKASTGLNPNNHATWHSSRLWQLARTWNAVRAAAAASGWGSHCASHQGPMSALRCGATALPTPDTSSPSAAAASVRTCGGRQKGGRRWPAALGHEPWCGVRAERSG